MTEEHPQYSMLIQWSDEDQVYVVSLPEWSERVFSNPVTHGDTYEEAAANGREVLGMLIDIAHEAGRPLPERHTLVAV